jgi:apolipoprotein N-acyltransferase
LQRSIAIAGALAAFMLFPLFGAGNRKVRRLLLAISSAVLIAVIASIGMSGCGGGPTTPNGTYSIQVTATSGSITQSATYSLTVQ